MPPPAPTSTLAHVRRIALLTLALVALAPSALAANQSISITDDGYTPAVVTIAPGEQVSWSYDNTVVVPRDVDFEDGSITDCPPGDATTSPENPCVRPFPNPGRYRFYDSTNGGVPCASYDACPQKGTVNVDAAASVAFSATPNPQRRDQPVGFDSTASEPGGSIAAYAWDFGDGNTSTAADPSHQYAAAGTYTVTLTVTDDLGHTASTQQTVSIFEPDDDADGVLNKDDLCPTVAAGTPDGCPLPVAPPPAEIDVNQVAADTLSVEGLRRDGLIAVVECTGPCSASAALLPVSGIRLAQTPAPMATATGTLAAAGTLKLSLRLTPAAKRALGRVRKSARLRLASTVTDVLGRVKSRATALTVSRVPAASRLPRVGISDQQAVTFTDPKFTVLGLRYARLVMPWDGVTSEPDRLDAWMQAARAAGVRPLIAFNHARGDLCPKRPCRAPSVARYTRAFRAFRKKYPWVRDFTPWNEANHSTQPTGKKPKLAAQYYNAMRRACRTCTITAADVLDQNNMRRWVTEFLRHAKGRPRLWGLHNYRDTNRFRDKGTALLLKLVKGEVWMTETGGIFSFETQAGVKALRPSAGRAKRAMQFMFKLAQKHHKRVKRVYIYQWRKNFDGDRFDAGVVTFDGKPRPSYDVLSLHATAARR